MSKQLFCISILAVVVLAGACGQLLSLSESNATSRESGEGAKKPMDADLVKQGLRLATFGAGCFWCVEAVFQRLKGVEKVVSGYSGGQAEKPTYEQVCTGTTGHAEVCQITYDPRIVSYDELLEVFWKTHDPTTQNRQETTLARSTGP